MNRVFLPLKANWCLWLVTELEVTCPIVSVQAADYNKEGRVDKARSLGSMAFIYDMVIVGIYAAAYIVSILSTIVAVAVVFSKASDAINTGANIVNNICNTDINGNTVCSSSSN